MSRIDLPYALNLLADKQIAQAMLLGISKAHVSLLIAGKRQPSRELAKLIAKLTGTTLELNGSGAFVWRLK